MFSQPSRGSGPQGGQPNVNDPYVGILTSKGPEAGIFRIKSTGVSTESIRKSADAFLAGLSEEQRGRTLYPVDDSEWRKWDNRHSPKRQGVGFNEMSEAQRKLSFEMLSQSLSAKGLKKTQDIMKLNGTLAELANNFQEYGEWLYCITVMGTMPKFACQKCVSMWTRLFLLGLAEQRQRVFITIAFTVPLF